MSANEAKSTQAWLEECEAFIETFHAPEKLTTACPGPSAVQRCTDELLTGAAEMARRRKMPMHIHLAETKAQAVHGAADLRQVAAQALGLNRCRWMPISRWRIRSGLKTTMSNCSRSEAQRRCTIRQAICASAAGLRKSGNFSPPASTLDWEPTARLPTTGKTCSMPCGWRR